MRGNISVSRLNTIVSRYLDGKFVLGVVHDEAGDPTDTVGLFGIQYKALTDFRAYPKGNALMKSKVVDGIQCFSIDEFNHINHITGMRV